MSRTQGRVDGDTGYADGHIFIPVGAGVLTSGTGTFTRNASGNISLNLGNSQTAVLEIPLRDLMFRYGVQDWLQEQFGSAQAGGAQGLPVGGYQALTTASAAAGSNVSVAVNTSVGFKAGRPVAAGTQNTFIASIPDSTHLVLTSLTATLASGSVIAQDLFTTPAGLTGAPPYTAGTSAPPNNLLPVTSPRPKGIGIRSIYPVYSAAGAALTLNTIGITKTVFANVTAPAVTTILANAANGLATATNAQPYLTPINLATPVVYLTSKFSEYVIEWDVTTAGGGTARIYGIFLDLLYNWN